MANETHKTDGVAETHRSLEEHRTVLRNLVNQRGELWTSIEQQVQELEAILAQFDPFDLIANILLTIGAPSPEKLKEHSFKGKDAYTEYITLLYLTKPWTAYPSPSH